MKNGNLREIPGGFYGGIGVYGGKNAFWILLNRRKTPKKAQLCATFIQLLTIFIQQMRAFWHTFDHFFTQKLWCKQFVNWVVVRISLLFCSSFDPPVADKPGGILGGEKKWKKPWINNNPCYNSGYVMTLAHGFYFYEEKDTSKTDILTGGNIRREQWETEHF